MKLTKKTISELEAIQTQLQRGVKFLLSDGYAFARRDKFPSTTLHYMRPDGKALYEVDREIGSELCLIYSALQRLNDMIQTAKQG